MTIPPKDTYFESGSLAKPPRFNADKFPLWKSRMELFLSGSDPQIPYFIEHGPYVPTAIIPSVAAITTSPAVPERTFIKQYEKFIAAKGETLAQTHQRVNCLLIDLKTYDATYSNSQKTDSEPVFDNETEFNESIALLSKHFKKFGRKGNFRKSKPLYKKNQFAETSTPASKDGKYQKLKAKYRKLKFQRKGKGLIAEGKYWDESSDESYDEEDTSELEDIPEEEVPVTPSSTSALPLAQEKGIWYLDSGWSKHMTGNKHILVNYKEEAGPSVKFGGEGRGISKGCGTLTNGKTTFKRLCDKDHKVSFSKKSCKVKNRHKKIILRGQIS
ncbi:hypothetical protein OSB04_019405 [Centaurea solstitialis]|uniref:Retrovirus-related Pol polyprotein from transposon TNT 1-94-like beta-barrel domain-containing protein n=1 Tax=Centaurea solstitialis TaxID=347529 RepID=A0AA38W2V8_9ASTR|nr:hypothetical protein OSB04_019405 [Centaurea solstitialis]